ncbi:MAG: ribonuclease P [Methanobacteriota archaeon]|nr:MAG: ribonuclease P [Euryarchaeota archaeon]TMA02736.1 MAG: ribonuclease P [Euryarchaeota archaeon]
MAKRRHRGMERRIAGERMATLFRLAETEALHRRTERARRYVELARRIGMRYNVRVPAPFKRSFCKKCFAFLLPSVSARIRVGEGRVVVTCGACGAVQRYPYRREQRARRASRARAQ